jgi:menaquinol-cytochrome c reductase iron-sulfur subunit
MGATVIKLEPASDRRSFFVSVIYGAWALIGAALGIPALAYLSLPPRAQKESEWTEAGDLSRLDPNVPEEVVFRRNRVDGWKISSEKTSAWVIKEPGNRITAFAPQCTHLGCAYHWEEQRQQFVCPCHSSIFARDGRVLSGPAPRPLDRYDVKIEGTKFLLGPVHKSEEKHA